MMLCPLSHCTVITLSLVVMLSSCPLSQQVTRNVVTLSTVTAGDLL